MTLREGPRLADFQGAGVSKGEGSGTVALPDRPLKREESRR
jgi:hypothetical protein